MHLHDANDLHIVASIPLVCDTWHSPCTVCTVTTTNPNAVAGECQVPQATLDQLLPSPRPWDFPPSIDGDISRADDPMELDDPE
jgi:hypothetical protein